MSSPNFKLPTLYSFFFLVVEPISTFVGAYYAHFQPAVYLQLTHAASSPSTPAEIPLATSIVLTQLANLYLLFGINEALVLRSTSSQQVWRAVLMGLLLADLGHLYSVSGLGAEVYFKFWTWNEMMWGNVGFVYVGAAMRIAFLLGVGLNTQSGREGAMKAEMRKELQTGSKRVT
ncbi:NADP-dependent alcohol dehydrogenase-like protein [Phlyctema vagabunda]|uniref:NADP-dependent alcohol dehydrogenase-like protein n=1 Tax=Phlyctema vagabunda TaxID=108571 RepID=A0ABR4P7S6_9HELO